MSAISRRQALTGGAAAGVAAVLPATVAIAAAPASDDLTELGRLTVAWMAADEKLVTAARATQGAFEPAMRERGGRGPARDAYEAKMQQRLHWGERMMELEKQVRALARKIGA